VRRNVDWRATDRVGNVPHKPINDELDIGLHRGIVEWLTVHIDEDRLCIRVRLSSVVSWLGKRYTRAGRADVNSVIL
jgi:hypothetical protein